MGPVDCKDTGARTHLSLFFQLMQRVNKHEALTNSSCLVLVFPTSPLCCVLVLVSAAPGALLLLFLLILMVVLHSTIGTTQHHSITQPKHHSNTATQHHSITAPQHFTHHSNKETQHHSNARLDYADSCTLVAPQGRIIRGPYRLVPAVCSP